jgi:isochorismate pyruvate lyase
MNTTVACESLEQIREQIDLIDGEIVALIARRASYVRQAATFKSTMTQVADPARVEQVIAKVRAHCAELRFDADLGEAVYRAMISGFIRLESNEVLSRQRS